MHYINVHGLSQIQRPSLEYTKKEEEASLDKTILPNPDYPSSTATLTRNEALVTLHYITKTEILRQGDEHEEITHFLLVDP